MELVRYPDDLEWDEEALIFDESIFGRIPFCNGNKNIKDFVADKVVYTNLELFNKSRRNLFIALFAVPEFRIKIKSSINPKASLLPERDLINIVESLNDFPNKGQFLDRLYLLDYFSGGCGYAVDERDKGDEVVLRKKYYFNKIKEFKSMVPKVFISDHLGSGSSDLPKKIVDDLVDEYSKLISNFNSYPLDCGIRTVLINIFRKCLTSKYSSPSKKIKDDIDLVALACAVPARRVIIYSRNSDIQAFRYFANHYLHLENIIDLNSRIS